MGRARQGTVISRSAAVERAYELAKSGHCRSVAEVIRHLAEEGTAYSKIRRRCQLNAAADFLRRADMTVAEIAHLSSFSDPTAFRRAFRHWTGKSPTAYRHEVLGVTAHVPVGVSCDWGTADS